jgi:hypothetical protein
MPSPDHARGLPRIVAGRCTTRRKYTCGTWKHQTQHRPVHSPPVLLLRSGLKVRKGPHRDLAVVRGQHTRVPGYLPPRPFLFGGLGQPPLEGGFLRAVPTFSSHFPGRNGLSGFGPRFRGGLFFTLVPICPVPCSL